MDNKTLENVKAHLMATSDEFRRLAEQHTEYDKRIHELSSRPYLTKEEEMEEVKLKKLKLRLKDQMFDIMEHHQMTPNAG
jgi:uncharacterized protein